MSGLIRPDIAEIRAMPRLASPLIKFGRNFLADHAGPILTDPRIALIELVANAYDAGATEVQIEWPAHIDGQFSIADNGTGMSQIEFRHRWSTLNYDRLGEQGKRVLFPREVVDAKPRIAFGRNGKGRHACFCFSDSYFIETWKDGKVTHALVEYGADLKSPFRIAFQNPASVPVGHGTVISTKIRKRHLSTQKVREAIGSKFLVDPEFKISVNGEPLELASLGSKKTTYVESALGVIPVHLLDGVRHDRTTHLRGITFWVANRMVGDPSWDGLDESGALLDGRSTAAKTYSFVVEADPLRDFVSADWKGFAADAACQQALRGVRGQIVETLKALLSENRRERKRAALLDNREMLRGLTPISKKTVGDFIDEVQQRCPTLSEEHLAKTIEVFVKLESARTGHDLLKQLLLARLKILTLGFQSWRTGPRWTPKSSSTN